MSADGAYQASADAAEAIRALNHATVHNDPEFFPSTVYSVLGELYTLASRLEQALGQLARPLTNALASGRSRIDGGAFAGDPAAAVLAATDELEAGREHVRQLHAALTRAQEAIAYLAVD